MDKLKILFKQLCSALIIILMGGIFLFSVSKIIVWLTNLFYIYLDFKNLIPELTYTTVIDYPDIRFLEIFLFINFALILGISLCIACYKLGKNSNAKISDIAIHTFKSIIINPSFLILTTIYNIVFIFLPLIFFKLVWSIIIIVVSVSILLILLHLWLKKFKIEYLENKTYSYNHKLTVFSLVFFLLFLVLFPLKNLYFKTFVALQNKMPIEIIETKQLMQIQDTKIFFNTAENLLKKYPKNYQIYTTIGRKYCSLEDYKNCVKYMQKAVNISPELLFWDDYIMLLNAYNQIGIINVDLAKQALNYYPETTISNYIFEYYRNKKDLKNLYLQNQYYWGEIDFYSVAFIFYKAQHYQKSLSLIEIALNKENSDSRNISSLFNKKQFFQKNFTRIIWNILLDNTTLNIFKSQKIKIYIKMKDFEQAEKLINKKTMHYEYAELLLAQEKYDELNEYWQKNNIQPIYEQTLKFHFQTDKNTFLKHYNSLPKESKKNININILYAKYLYEKGDYQKTIEILQPFEDKNWFNLELLTILKNSYEKLNDREKTAEYNKKIKKIENAFK